MRILIVDDENEACRAMSCFLGRSNAEVVSLNDSAEAARRIKDEHFDAMFIDYVMPTPNGLELMSLARKSPLNQETPIILVTGYDDQATRSAGAEAGAEYFLAKPFTPQKIRGVLRAALANRGHSEAPGMQPARGGAAF